MSRCPSDGPVLKSILGLYRPTADCLLSLFLSLLLFQQSITFHLHQSVFLLPPFPHPLPPIFPISPSLCSLQRRSLCPVSLSFTSSSSSPRSLISGPIQPSFLPFLFGPLTVSSHKSLCQLSDGRLFVSLCHSLFLSLSLRPISYCLTLSWCFSSRQLMENKISTIERGAFQDLKELERLWVTFYKRGGRHFMP